MENTWKLLDNVVRHCHCETRFTDPAWTRDRDQAHILTQQESFGGSYFLFSPHKPGPLHWNIGRARLHLFNWSLREAVANGCKFPCEISGRDVTLIGLFCQTSLDCPAQRSGRVGILHSD